MHASDEGVGDVPALFPMSFRCVGPDNFVLEGVVGCARTSLIRTFSSDPKLVFFWSMPLPLRLPLGDECNSMVLLVEGRWRE